MMTSLEVILQQLINGLSLGAIYALLALGFTMVYGILTLINFAHFNVFMVGSFVGLLALHALGIAGQQTILTGLPLAGVLIVALAVTLLTSGLLGVLIERIALRPLRNVSGPMAMISTIGVSYILFNAILLTMGADSQNYPNPIPPLEWVMGGVVLQLRELLVWGVSLSLMVGLHLFVKKTRTGKAMRATAQDQEAARMMGVEVDRVIMSTFFIGSALGGAAGLIFGLYYNYTSFIIGYSLGLKAFTAAVVGGIGSIPGAVLGAFTIGIIEAMSGQIIDVRWTDVVVFSMLIITMVFRPAGLLGRATSQKS
jgi:branched-chain amino acid transport system permease protein